MAGTETRISELPQATTLDGSELLPVVQGGVTKRASVIQVQSQVLLSESFLTVDNESATAPESRRVAFSGGLTRVDGGPGSTFTFNTSGLLNSLSALGSSGFMVNNGGAAVARSLVQPSAGLTISNADGTGGNPTLALANDLAALEGIGTTGFAKRTGTDAWTTALISLTADVSGTLPVANGGTGLTAGTSGGVLGYTAAGTLASSAALTANALVLGGGAGATPTTPVGLGTTTTLLHGNAAGAPSFAAVSLTADVSGTLPATNGGTGFASYAVGDILYASTTTALSKLADVAAGSFLRSGGVATAPAWSTTVWTNSATQGDLLFASAANTYTNLAKDTNATRYLSNTGTSNNPAWAQVNLANGVTGTLPVANGGTGLTGGTSGGVLGYTAAGTLASSAALTANAIVLGGGAGATPTTPVGLGTTTTLLHGNAAGAPSFAAVSLTADVSGTLPVANGGTGVTTVVAIAALFTRPTTQTFTTGSGTYTTPANVRWIRRRIVGGGGGGQGSGTTPGSGTTGGNTTFGTLTGSGGVSGGGGGTGGAASGGLINAPGDPGGGAVATGAAYGGVGGSTRLGGGGTGGNNAPSAGNPAPANTGGGGGGGGGAAAVTSGIGGGGGGYVEDVVIGPAATYSYAVGAGGAGGAAGTSGAAGGAGSAGFILIEEYYI